MTWPTAPLEEVCAKIGSGATPRGGNKSYKPSGIALVRSMNVHMGRFKPDNLAFIDESQAAKLNNVVLEPDDVLLNITGASVARSCTLDNSVLPARVNQHVCILRPEPKKLNYQYLMHFLTAGQTQKKLLRIAGAGATREAITKTEIQKFPIPLPPLAEQKRIAAILDTADALRTKRREALAQLDALLQSTFLEMFGDPVANPKGWPQNTLSDVLNTDRPISYGILKPGNYEKDGVIMLRIQDIRGGQVSDNNLHRVSTNLSTQYERTLLSGNEIVISVVGTIGLCALIPTCFAGANVHRNLAVVAPGETMAPQFLHQYMVSDHFQLQISQTTKGANQGLLNLGDLKRLSVPVPPIHEQRHFAAIVESVERQKAHQRAHLSELDALFASLQHRAFNDELSPHDLEGVFLLDTGAARTAQPHSKKKSARV